MTALPRGPSIIGRSCKLAKAQEWLKVLFRGITQAWLRMSFNEGHARLPSISPSDVARLEMNICLGLLVRNHRPCKYRGRTGSSSTASPTASLACRSAHREYAFHFVDIPGCHDAVFEHEVELEACNCPGRDPQHVPCLLSSIGNRALHAW